MKILITGAAGFIGFHLSRFLLRKGFLVHGIDNLNDYYDSKLKNERLKRLKKFKNFLFDLQDINQIKIKDPNFDLAINLAAQAGVRLQPEDHWKYEHSNINGFKSFLYFCKCADIKNIIYASSSSVYSGVNEIPFKEKLELKKPTSKYAETKIINENEAALFAKGDPEARIIGLRFFTVYGAWGRPDMAYYLFSENIQNKNVIQLFNKGESARDMTNIKDIVDGIYLSIKHIRKSKKRHEIFNLGNTKPIKTNNLLGIIETKLNMKAKVKLVHNQDEPMITMADLAKSKKYLGYDPKIALNEGLDDFFYWYKKYNNG